MPGEVIDRPNPPPLPSQLPSSVEQLAVTPAKATLSSHDVHSLKEFQRAACYIASAMIFLKDNVLLERNISLEDVKPRLLGHWGTCPGLILIWSHLNVIIRDHSMDMLLVIGPGHGAPAALSCLWLEGSLEKFYPREYPTNREGLTNLITKFCLPGGFPSHINPETPGAIHEGGELGYALAVAFGAVMDNPDLIVTCIVGDGEAETGPTAAAWHSIKYLDPSESGAVIPVLHVNGFKISERIIFGCMDNKELVALFSGYGYQVCIVETLKDIDAELHSALEWACAEIRDIQKAARTGNAVVKPRWPMIVLRSPKGWTGPRMVDDKIIEGSFNAHQVPLARANTDENHLRILQDWLQSYDVRELLAEGRPSKGVLQTLPTQSSTKLGQLPVSYNSYQRVDLPDWQPFAARTSGQRKDQGRGQEKASSMEQSGKLLNEVAKRNKHTFRIFSPDELESNKLGTMLESTGRNFQWDQYSRNHGGRVIEILSEHCCQGFMQGYTLTGRTAVFPSYESFLGIIHTMMVQYGKFSKVARGLRWRGPLSSVNYIETSTWTRQEHNGFSHQNPSFIGAVLNLKADTARVYLPPDANCFLSTLHHCLKSKNYVNLLIGSKQPTPVYLSAEEAAEHCRKGISVWKFACNPHGGDDPDVVLVGIGVEVTFEVIKAAELLARLIPELHVRVINVTDLLVLPAESRHPHALSQSDFAELFPGQKPVCFNYHGYETELQGILFGRPGLDLMTVEGYKEEGSTTTPFDMMLVNRVSRFHVASRALKAAAPYKSIGDRVDDLLHKIAAEMREAKRYIEEHGKDPDDFYELKRKDLVS